MMRSILPCPKCGSVKKTKRGDCAPCKVIYNRARMQTPEAQAKRRAWLARPEVKARIRELKQSPSYKEKARRRAMSPEYRAKLAAKMHDATYRAKVAQRIALYYKRPEVRARVRAAQAKHQASEKGRRRVRAWKRGITVDELLAMELHQQGRCASCGDEFGSKKACLDHDHVTGLVRAILCHPCNVAAGFLRDSSLRARKLAAYLDRFAQVPMVTYRPRYRRHVRPPWSLPKQGSRV